MTERFFLSMDNDSLWFIIPVSRQKDWEDWTDLPEDSEEAWSAPTPTWAKQIGGSPTRVTFTDWTIE